MKLKSAFGIIILFFASTAHLLAQTAPNPCYSDDLDGGCPLDTWVIALAIAASFFAFIKLYRSKKSFL